MTRDPAADRIQAVVMAALTRTQRGLVSELELSPTLPPKPTECPPSAWSDSTTSTRSPETPASVLFADVAGFTPMSAKMSPPGLVGLLNTVFSTFDEFVQDLGLEKIKTVGDEYMVAAGMPSFWPDHAHAIAELALRIRDRCAQQQFDGHDLSLRIGINSGPVVARIVGTHKFAYDLWGGAVNTASRMKSHGILGSIQISSATHHLIRDAYVCERRGTIEVKGVGDVETSFLLARRGGGPKAVLPAGSAAADLG